MHFMLFILIGLIAGALAGRVVSGHGYGMVGDIVVGVVGAFEGGWIFATFLGVGGGGFFLSLFTAVLPPRALLWLIRLLVPGPASGAAASARRPGHGGARGGGSVREGGGGAWAARGAAPRPRRGAGRPTPAPPPLELPPNGQGESLEQPVHRAPLPPGLRVDPAGVHEIVREHLLQPYRHVVAVHDEVHLLVEGERARVQIGAPDRRPPTVDHHGLGV